MPRPKTRTVAPEAVTSNGFLLDALKFCSLVTNDKGTPYETHVCLGQHWVSAFNGVIGCGHPIAEDIYTFPHNSLLIEALSKCGEHMSITQMDENRLSIKSNKFKAIVPCLKAEYMQVAQPDPPVAVIDDRFKQAIEAVGVIGGENGVLIYNASILMNGYSVIATDGKVILEYWHGVDLPPGLALPKAIVAPLTKTNKKLAKFGFSSSSVTFYFEDQSWIKSQLYSDRWPNVNHILDRETKPLSVPADLFQALAAVAPFSENGLVYFDQGLLKSHPTDGHGAAYEVAGLPKGPIFNIKQLSLLKPHAQTIDFFVHGNPPMTIFYGLNIRGGIAGRME